MNQFLQFAKKVLEKSEAPLIYQDIWKKGLEFGIEKEIDTTGKTPWQTLGARLFVEVRDNPDSLFVKVGKRPAKFYLKSKINTLSTEVIDKIDQEEVNCALLSTHIFSRFKVYYAACCARSTTWND